MNELDAIKLEGKEFVIIDEIIINNTKYVHLASASDVNDFCIRKVVMMGENEILTGLDSDEEFDMALDSFAKKNYEDLEN